MRTISRSAAFIALMMLCSASLYFGQPTRPQGRPTTPPQQWPNIGPPRGDRPMQPGEWMSIHDTNNDGRLDSTEFKEACDRTFTELDRNSNGVIDVGEAVRTQQPPLRGVNEPSIRPGRLLPPFFFLDRAQKSGSYSREDFGRMVGEVFAEMDKNADGVIDRGEARVLPPRPVGPSPPPMDPPLPPNAQFIAAELRFGDRLVTGQPFSADIVIQDTRRLFDGSTVTRSSKGAIFRDTSGRTRREQPLEIVAGMPMVGLDGGSQVLVFISDFASRTRIYLDSKERVAQRTPIGAQTGPIDATPRSDAKEESLGTKSIEGIPVEGTRVTFDIPIGHIGNDKPLQAITERWFSKDLQLLIMSRHLDPIAGEHIFKLENIRRAEPAPELFVIPAGYRILDRPTRRPGE